MKAKLFMSLALVGALCCSCSSFDDINDNPNDPTAVSPKLILPNVCESAFSRGTGGMYADKMVVQTDVIMRNSFMSGTGAASVLITMSFFR